MNISRSISALKVIACAKRLVFGVVAAVVCFSSIGAEHASAAPSAVGTQGLPRVFQPVARKFSRSPIPVFVPTWLPALAGKPSVKSVKFSTFKRTFLPETKSFFGPGYELDLYSSARYQDHAHELFAIRGEAGDVYNVDTHTQPVWLGRAGWAYINPNAGTNAGYTITVARAVAHPGAFYPPEYTYTVRDTCGAVSYARLVGCLKHVASSTQRYTPSRSMR